MDELLRELASIDAASVLRNDYHKTLALLRALKAGTITLDNVTMTATGWNVAAVAPPEPPAGEPAAEPDEVSDEVPVEVMEGPDG